MSKLIIKAKYAKLINPFCSKNDNRYYLEGFNVKPNPLGDGVLICATDGHTLGLFHDADGVVECAAHQESSGDIWALEKDTLKACVSKSATAELWLVILPMQDSVTAHNLYIVAASDAASAQEVVAGMHHSMILHTAIIQPIDGSFPEYSRVVPAFPPYAPNRPVATYNGAYMAKFAAVSKSEDGLSERVTIHAEDCTSAALVETSRADFLGVLMPLRNDPWENLPEWYRTIDKPAAVEKKTA